VVALAVLAGGCRRGDPEPQPRRRPSAASPSPRVTTPAPDPELGAYLEGAALEASYDTTTLARFGRSLPRPSPTDSPLVAMFGGIVEYFVGDPGARLDALGLEADAEIRLSIRALDGRAAAVRKLLGELEGDEAPAPELLAQLSSEARTLGVHLRASLPVSDRGRLLRALELLTITDDDAGPWARACEQLEGVALCSGRPRLLMWARSEGEARLRVDAVYLFYAGAEAADLDRALARADGWPDRSEAPDFGAPAPMQVSIHAPTTLTVLEAEALADAAVVFTSPEGEFDYHDYLDREQALRDLVPPRRVFDGVALDIRLDEDDRFALELGWLGGPRPAASRAELFAPVVERGTLPVVHGDCEIAQICARVAGLSSIARFSPLARGPFADTTGAARVMRQAGERGQILLALSSWPNLLGTAAATAAAERGLLGQAQAALLGDSCGFGVFVLELGDEEPEDGVAERWVGYLRVGPEALDALRPALTLFGMSPRPLELAGVESQIERGTWEGIAVYLVDESLRQGGFGGWLLAADDDERVPWLLETPREASEPGSVSPIWYLHVASLGPIAAREEVAYTDDPPIRTWLDGRGLELRGEFAGAAGPRVELELSPK
jgi:hypothetical protein